MTFPALGCHCRAVIGRSPRLVQNGGSLAGLAGGGPSSSLDCAAMYAWTFCPNARVAGLSGPLTSCRQRGHCLRWNLYNTCRNRQSVCHGGSERVFPGLSLRSCFPLMTLKESCLLFAVRGEIRSLRLALKPDVPPESARLSLQPSDFRYLPGKLRWQIVEFSSDCSDFSRVMFLLGAYVVVCFRWRTSCNRNCSSTHDWPGLRISRCTTPAFGAGFVDCDLRSSAPGGRVRAVVP